ncbi:hypothetical protein G7Z17_g3106 [Cylindrodendrum hubeiense]|uniref:Uncharacterized protein n=1 Tax=Cylindrodendrum hubeiense TaxID=595255 RepID=A0A9P5HGF1_9HYPO|nr:hypothetical protein G7Z17_g3106 [Cylindrodendrum hubeiense]
MFWKPDDHLWTRPNASVAVAFASPNIADLLYTNAKFCWASDAFVLIVLAFCAPVAAIFFSAARKAKKAGIGQVTVHIALWGMSIGAPIAGAIWTNVLHNNMKDQATTIYGDITVQLWYPLAGEARDAVTEAYSVVQHKMVVIGSGFISLCIISMLTGRNIDIKKHDEESEQAEGNIW